jgi:hypothetical protein
MDLNYFTHRLDRLERGHRALISRSNQPDPTGTILIYYTSSDTRIHVATSRVERLLDYVKHTPEDGLRSAASVQQRIELIRRNLK